MFLITRVRNINMIISIIRFIPSERMSVTRKRFWGRIYVVLGRSWYERIWGNGASRKQACP